LKPTKNSEMPQVNGVERIEVLETRVTKQKLIRTPAGAIISYDIDFDEQ
jgi:hypothetical protein